MNKRLVAVAVIVGLLAGAVPAFGQMDAWGGGWSYAATAVMIVSVYQDSLIGFFYASLAAARQAEYDKRCAICVGMSPTRNPGTCYGYEPVTCDTACTLSKIPRTGCSYDEYFLVY